jgi:hypothetical protein
LREENKSGFSSALSVAGRTGERRKEQGDDAEQSKKQEKEKRG